MLVSYYRKGLFLGLFLVDNAKVTLQTRQRRAIIPVKVRTMRLVYRDIIAASAAGMGIFEVFATIPPIARIDVCRISWTGNPDAPVALRREQSLGRKAIKLPEGGQSNWYRFAAGSAICRMIDTEYDAYYPDANRDYSRLLEHGELAYKLVIGNRLVSVVFERNNPFTMLKQQINSLLDMIVQSLLDYMHRQIRQHQDAIVFSLKSDEGTGLGDVGNQIDIDVRTIMGEGNKAAQEAIELMQNNANLLASFFDIVKVEFLLTPDISKLVLFRQVLAATQYKNKHFHRITLSVGPFCCEDGETSLKVDEFPLQWGSNNENDKFIIRLHSYRDLNDHVSRILNLKQVLIECKEQVETLFDRRYREYRIYQDNKHFERCKQVRTQAVNLQSIRQNLRDSVAEYEEEARTIERELIFPRFADWAEKLATVIKDIHGEVLEFRDEIRLRDLREYTYLNMKVPVELRNILLQAMDPEVYILVESEHPVLTRMSDVPEGLDTSSFGKRQVFFNNAATVSILYPSALHFRFNRLKGKFYEFLESVGEGIGRLFAFINTQTGIKNRLALVQSLEYLVKQVAYSSQVILEVSGLDIFSFKIFNELFGHPFGDRVIRYTAHTLDGFSPGYAYHISGDEYYIVHCYHEATTEAWMRDFFASKEIIPEETWREHRTGLEAFTAGIPVCVPLTDVQDSLPQAEHALGTYRLVDFIANFFTKNTDGAVSLKQYSRTGNDYHRILQDPQRCVQTLVDQTFAALQAGSIKIDDDSFGAFVLKHNCVGDSLYILPCLTIGTLSYNCKTVVPYVSDIIDAVDKEAGKNKK